MLTMVKLGQKILQLLGDRPKKDFAQAVGQSPQNINYKLSSDMPLSFVEKASRYLGVNLFTFLIKPEDLTGKELEADHPLRDLQVMLRKAKETEMQLEHCRDQLQVMERLNVVMEENLKYQKALRQKGADTEGEDTE